MAVYEQTYKRYAGKLTPEWSRFLIIPRHALRGVFNSKLFTAFFVICFIPLLVEAVLIYLHHNVTALAIMNAQRPGTGADRWFVLSNVRQHPGWLCFCSGAAGWTTTRSRVPAQQRVAALSCRPFSRTEYVMGKMSVILILLSAVTWDTAVVALLLQSYLEGFAWFRANLWIASAIVIGSVVWILLLALLSQTISALVKWRVVASAAMLGLFLIPSCVWRVHQPRLSNALGTHRQPRRADEECDRRSFRHVRSCVRKNADNRLGRQ